MDGMNSAGPGIERDIRQGLGKAADSGAAQKISAVPPSARGGEEPGVVFGPVMEREMQLGANDGPTEWLNPDEGTLIEKPRGWWIVQTAETKERNTLPGLGFSRTDLGFQATAIGMVFLSPVPSQKWDSSAARAVVEEAERSVSEHLANSRSPLGDLMLITADDYKWPKTYVFKTPRRTYGILQVVGFTGNPPRAQIRYKLAVERP
jgi:hypothetical protein